VLPDVAFAPVRYVKRKLWIRHPEAIYAKETYISDKETNISEKETNIPGKETYTSGKETEKRFIEETFRHYI